MLTLMFLTGCATRSLPKFEKPIPRTPVQSVVASAYTHSEKDHRKYGRKTALGTTLQYGEVTTAATDWSRWPVGTRFRVRETGREYVVEDYGWALAGTNRVDLYFDSRSGMNAWGLRRVEIEILEWGDDARSYRILKGREKHRHVKRMVQQMEAR